MAFNGSGVFQRLHNWVQDRTNGIKINALRMDEEMNGFADGLSNCITRDGQTRVQADIPMNGRKLTGLGAATEGDHALSREAADARYAPKDINIEAGAGNRLLNGNLTVCQRGAGTVPNDAYCFDRWYALCENGSIDYAPVANGGGYVGSNSGGAGHYRVAVAQIIESKDCFDLRSKSVTFSGQVGSGSAGGGYFAGILATTATDAVISNFVDLWNAPYQESAFLYFIPEVSLVSLTTADRGETFSVSGTVPADATNLIAFVVSAAGHVDGERLYLSEMQLEAGVQTAFVHRPQAVELAACQRLYQRHTVVVDDVNGFRTLMLPAAMRRAPTITGGGPGFTNATPAATQALNLYQSARATQTLAFDAEL